MKKGDKNIWLRFKMYNFLFLLNKDDTLLSLSQNISNNGFDTSKTIFIDETYPTSKDKKTYTISGIEAFKSMN